MRLELGESTRDTEVRTYTTSLTPTPTLGLGLTPTLALGLTPTLALTPQP
jgi:hypothetical protein